MAKRIYKTVNGQKIDLTPKEIKNFIMKVNNWSSEEYNKQRYLIKNKLRTYEAFTGYEKQSPVEFLYFEAKSKKFYGKDYKPSMKREQIEKYQTLGSQKAIEKALKSQKITTKWREDYNDYVDKRFKNFIDKNPKAKEINDAISDPVKREQALSAYANQLKLKIKESEEIEANQAIPFGETLGSSADISFDYSSYM